MEKKEEKAKPKTKDEIERDVNKLKDKILERYGDVVKCIVMMGSVARGEFKPKSDVDVFIVVDDTVKEITPEEKSEIDDTLEKMATEISPDISIQPSYTLTEFWDYARVCHPIIYNFIKEGKAVYDVGFFMPIKRLLEMGKIPATREAIESYMEGAPKKLMRAKTVKLLMLAEDCYYAMLNTAQAVLMFMGLEPPVPNKVYDEVKKYLVDPGTLEQKYADWLKEIIEVRKKIEHKELMDVTGAFVDEWIDKADKFIEKMFQLLSILEFRKKEKILERTHEVMYKAAIAALKTLHKLPEKTEEIPDAFKREFVDTKLVEGYYWDIWNKIEEMKGLAEKQALDKVPDKDVYKMREYVRNLIRDLAKVLKKKEKSKKEKS
ncbi:MAG: nucleotidyltransferase domain-containing protein [Candidatus Aenigmarchaeota archaeon]|nr:nucleotidyltransferase domain-containing protein [Candidatus Aenigmarchaeota archaeon]